MPRRGPGAKVRYQCRLAAKSLNKVLDHLMAADVIAKGGEVDGHGKLLPRGVDIHNPDREGHPVLNEYLPTLIQLVSATQDAITRMVAKL